MKKSNLRGKKRIECSIQKTVYNSILNCMQKYIKEYIMINFVKRCWVVTWEQNWPLEFSNMQVIDDLDKISFNEVGEVKAYLK